MHSTSYRHFDEMVASHHAAEIIVPLILELTGPVASVVDVGGGDGGWLRVFQSHGCKDIFLLDTPEVRQHLLIDPASFQPVDMLHDDPPVRKSDLAICLECAEHLPSGREEWLINYLTSTADVVVFSAALPGQGGKGHVNEQSHSHWRALFQRHGFRCLDALRGQIVHDPSIPWWYRQNLFVYASDRARINCSYTPFLPADMCLVHFEVWNRILNCGIRERLRLILLDIQRRFFGN